MAEQRVTFTIDADHMPASQAFAHVSNALKGVGVTAIQVSNEASKGAQKMGDGFGNAGMVLGRLQGTLAQLTLGTTAFYFAARTGAAEWQQAIDVNLQAMEKTRGFLSAHQKVGYNAGDTAYLSSPEGARMTREGMLHRGSKNPADYLENLATGFSTRGTIPVKKAHDLVNEMTTIGGMQHLSQSDMNETISALNMMMAKDINAGKDVNPKELIGSFFGMQGVNPSPDLADFGAYAVQAALKLTAQHGWTSNEAAVARTSNLQLKNADKPGRRSKTMAVHMDQQLEEAYAKTYWMAGNSTLTPAEFRNLGEKKWELLQTDPELNEIINGYLFGEESEDPKAVEWAAVFGNGVPGFTGHHTGEIGEKESMMDYTAKNSPAMAAEKKLLEEMPRGKAAVDFEEKLKTGNLTDPIGRNAAQDNLNNGLMATLDYDNQLLSARGFPIELQKEIDVKLGKGYIASKLQEFGINAMAMGATEIKASELNEFIASNAQHHVLNRNDLSFDATNQDFAKWLNQRPAEKAAYRDADPSKGTPAAWMKYAVPRLPDEDRRLYESLEAFRGLQQPIVGAAREAVASPKPPSELVPAATPAERAEEATRARQADQPSLTPRKRLFETDEKYQERVGSPGPEPFPDYKSWRAKQKRGGWFGGMLGDSEDLLRNYPAEYKAQKADYELKNPETVPEPAKPAETDQSMRMMMDRLERLAMAIETAGERSLRGSVDINVHDPAGRPLSRATSRPRALELLQDNLA